MGFGVVPSIPLQLTGDLSQFSAFLVVSVPIFQMKNQPRMSLASLSESSALVTIQLAEIGFSLFRWKSPEDKE